MEDGGWRMYRPSLTARHSPLTTHRSPRTTHHAPHIAQHSALSTQHSALSTQHSALRTPHPPTSMLPHPPRIKAQLLGQQRRQRRHAQAALAWAGGNPQPALEGIEGAGRHKATDSGADLASANHSAGADDLTITPVALQQY